MKRYVSNCQKLTNQLSKELQGLNQEMQSVSVNNHAINNLQKDNKTMSLYQNGQFPRNKNKCIKQGIPPGSNQKSILETLLQDPILSPSNRHAYPHTPHQYYARPTIRSDETSNYEGPAVSS